MGKTFILIFAICGHIGNIHVTAECNTSGCQNGGTCSSDVCTCVAGYEGTNCETNIDECATTPCQNGGTCTDAVNSYTCACDAGYEGTNCETNIDECATTPCQNGGTCTDAVNSYTCACDAGYEGTNCETNIDECATTPCQNGGTCTDAVNSYTCACDAGYEGTNCETNIDKCASAPCQNGGTCTDAVNSYTCICDAGYEGNNCETKPPSTPRGFTIDYIQHNKARLSWLPGNNGGLTQTFVIQLGTGETSWEDTEVQDEVYQNDKPMFKILAGLSDSTTYFVRMYAYNKVGNSPLSGILIFTTSPIKVETETKTTTTLIVGVVLSVVVVVVISYAIYVRIQLKRTRDSVQKDGRAQKIDGQVNIHIEDSTNIPDRGGYENPYTDLKTEMRDSRSPYEAISTM